MKTFDVRMRFKHTAFDLERAVKRKLGWRDDANFRILRRSIDARKKDSIRVVYRVTTDMHDPLDDLYKEIENVRGKHEGRRLPKIVIVGSGPAGMFAAQHLASAGVPSTIVEQGPDLVDRIKKIAAFYRRGVLDPLGNIGFGAGGAGAFSDGKLYTRIKSPLAGYVLNELRKAGAPETVTFDATAHIGSNKLRNCLRVLFERLRGGGVTIRFDEKLLDVGIDNGKVRSVLTSKGRIDDVDYLLLAAGHSAMDVFRMLSERDVALEFKPFAVGLRVEHLKETINRLQYGADYSAKYEGIEAANYRLAHTDSSGRGCYSFCMCPGGYIINSSTESSGVVTNGMSNYGYRAPYSNSGIVVGVDEADVSALGFSGVLGGLELQRNLESEFRGLVNAEGSARVIPGQRLRDFLEGRASKSLPGNSSVPCALPAELSGKLPSFVLGGIKGALEAFERQLPGFQTGEEACIFGVETRTSSPVRILRDRETFQSPSAENLYPLGEGAGYAGGIVSSAVDGVGAAIKILEGIRS
ncbi:MAG: FAD-dependent monooxygenase [Planctomycetes bacterium]|nr:FAD-dependent monooxygenase [Planctomycetota bacterium]